jgi:beta-galactosidase
MSPEHFSRRRFVGAASLIAVGLPVVFGRSYPSFAAGVAEGAASPYIPPESPRFTINFNVDWKFFRDDVKDAETVVFDDSKWATISTPHSFNDVDSFRSIISHSGGDRGTYKGIAWYRKHFKLPADLAGHNLFLEFEGMRQAGAIFLNGKEVGLSENGVNAYGIDITDTVKLGNEENILAVKLDNRTTYAERATNTSFEWNVNDFNPDHGGIDRSVWLHVTGKIHQTLPLYYGLESEGIYVHAANFDIARKTAGITVESEVRNSSSGRATVSLSAVVVDHTGIVHAQFDGAPIEMTDGAKTIHRATGTVKDARFWSPDDPQLYDVYTILKVGDKVVDVARTETGFRKAEFKGGAGKGGIYLNEKFFYLKGYAQRCTNEWAALGGGYPDWLRDLTAKMIRDSHANYIRWMHVSPKKADADAMARYGIVQLCPAGDKESDKQGRQWEQRAEVMRNSMIYFRNNPSILFWEAGGTVITPEHMQQMNALQKQWDPHGQRVVGSRDSSDAAPNQLLTPISGYFGVMISQDPRVDQLAQPTDLFRGFSAQRRDLAPIIEVEDFREEGARRMWDDYSPPYYKVKKGPDDTWMANSDYLFTSESFALAGVGRYWEYWENRISNSDPAHSRWSGYASIYFSDSDADGRQDSSEVARVSGKVDAVRLPKEIYYAHRVMQNEQPDLHILGHWSYPAVQPDGTNTVKTIYVIANTESVELFVNGKSAGVNSKPTSGWIFSWPQIEFVPGTLRAVGKNSAKVVAEQELTTAGAPAAINLTAIAGPNGLQADARDAVLIDVEVVDAKGRRCPTDDGRIDFTCTGPAIWRGGYNSGKINSTNNLYLNTELGINRVAVRSTLTPGTITITAARDGLKPAQVQIVSKAVNLKDGLSTLAAQHLPVPT